MKPYGLKRNDSGCCPGHDKFPLETYKSSRSKHARARGKQAMHQRARAIAARELHDLREEQDAQP